VPIHCGKKAERVPLLRIVRARLSMSEIDGNAVDISNLKFSYGRVTVIDQLSLSIPNGLSFGILGANGAGKTTLIRLMVGLLKPASGSIRCLREAPGPATAAKTGYMPQLTSLYNELTVYENIDFFGRIYGLKDKTERRIRVEEVVRLVELWDKRDAPVSNLSGGMKQRVSLGCAIVHEPQLLFLDEPTVGLDVELRVRFWEYFGGLTAEGKTLVISSHTMDDAAHCERLAFMRSGKIIALGAPSQLIDAVGKKGASLEDAFVYFVRHGEASNA
jgi:ABC-2 type transport system ATP-binding protein